MPMLALACLALPPLAVAQPAAPGILLEQADVYRARALALDAALIKGWQLIESGPDHSVFETPIERSSEPDGAAAGAWLRIRAAYRPGPAGVRVELQAEERWRASDGATTRLDVTERYRGNLDRALDSLHRQWADLVPGSHGSQPGNPAPRAKLEEAGNPAAAPAAAPPAAPPEDEVGLWAYYAEQRALDLGCELTDRGAVLIGYDADAERHRVDCHNRAALRLLCTRDGCRQ